MNYWLIKSEPSVYSWDQFVAEKETFWNGVRNYAARNNLRSMKKGDLAFWYHSNEGMEIVGIAGILPGSNNRRPRLAGGRFQTIQKIKKPGKPRGYES